MRNRKKIVAIFINFICLFFCLEIETNIYNKLAKEREKIEMEKKETQNTH